MELSRTISDYLLKQEQDHTILKLFVWPTRTDIQTNVRVIEELALLKIFFWSSIFFFNENTSHNLLHSEDRCMSCPSSEDYVKWWMKKDIDKVPHQILSFLSRFNNLQRLVSSFNKVLLALPIHAKHRNHNLYQDELWSQLVQTFLLSLYLNFYLSIELFICWSNL